MSAESGRSSGQPPQRVSSDPEYAANLRRASLASTVGSALEYYDFALYGLASALILPQLFFPSFSPASGLVASFAVYGAGFVARPLGGLFFGVIGDRLGRKRVLVITILLMGGSSTLVGALPTFSSVGLLAPILLVILRLLQGFGAGAEQAGSTVLMSEYAPVERRGFFSAIPFIGIQGGTLLASLVFIGLARVSEDTVLGGLWRIPFLASAVLIALGLFIRVKLSETPTFVELEENEQISEHPIREVFGHSLGTVLRGIGLRMAENGGSYMFSTLAVAFITTSTVGLGRGVGSLGVAIGSILAMISNPLAGRISDRFGRVPVYRAGAIFLLLYSLPAWYGLSRGVAWSSVVIIAVGIGVGIGTMLGPQCALLPELFGAQHRYLGVAAAREISGLIAGGLAGVLGALLLRQFSDSWVPVGIYMLVLAAITTLATFLTPETRGRDLSATEDAVDDPDLAGARR